MYETITKKEFIETLKNSRHEQIYSNMNMSETAVTKIMRWLYYGYFDVINGRKCVNSNSNSITFDDGGKLYVNNIHKCYRHNNIILNYKEWYDSFDECFKYSTMAYVIEH